MDLFLSPLSSLLVLVLRLSGCCHLNDLFCDYELRCWNYLNNKCCSASVAEAHQAQCSAKLNFTQQSQIHTPRFLFELVGDIKQINCKQLLIFLSLIFTSDIERI